MTKHRPYLIEIRFPNFEILMTEADVEDLSGQLGDVSSSKVTHIKLREPLILKITANSITHSIKGESKGTKLTVGYE